MKLKMLALIIFFTISALLHGSDKKNILVLCSNGGFCHNAAAQTLKNLMGETYNLKIIYPIDEMHFFGVKSGEGWYNTMLQNDWIEPVKFASRYVAPKVFRLQKNKLEALIHKHIDDIHADLVISVIPFVNYSASEAARKADVPFLLVTMDDDLQMWVHGLQNVQHAEFKMTVGAHLDTNRDVLKKRKVPDGAIEMIGFPIRTDFISEKNRDAIREEYGIPKDKPVALVIAGGAGGKKALSYAREIGETQYGLHLIVCAGKNKKLAQDLRKIKLHPSNTMTVMEFTTRIADLMAVSDLLITKPGSGTFHEAMLMRLPILADATSTVLSWEKTNIDLIKQYGIGDSVDNFKELEYLLREFLFDTEKQKEVKDSYKKIPENRFNESIISLVSSMCGDHETNS